MSHAAPTSIDSKTVRIICEPNTSSPTRTTSPIVFDFTSSSFGGNHVRAIQKNVSSSVAATTLDSHHGVCSCERFDISGDDDCESIPGDLLTLNLLEQQEHVRMVQISEVENDTVEIVIDSCR